MLKLHLFAKKLEKISVGLTTDKYSDEVIMNVDKKVYCKPILFFLPLKAIPNETCNNRLHFMFREYYYDDGTICTEMVKKIADELTEKRNFTTLTNTKAKWKDVRKRLH